MITRRVCLVLTFLVLFPNVIHSHGRIYLFADTYSTRMSTDIEANGTRDIYIAYSDENNTGPDGITGLEFRIDIGSTYVVFSGQPVWMDPVSLTMGSLEAGISIALDGCYGIGDRFVFVGSFTIMSFQEIVSGDPAVIIRVMPDPTDGVDYLLVSGCDADHSVHDVYGAFFYLPYSASKISNEPSSWGVVKSLFR